MEPGLEVLNSPVWCATEGSFDGFPLPDLLLILTGDLLPLDSLFNLMLLA